MSRQQRLDVVLGHAGQRNYAQATAVLDAAPRAERLSIVRDVTQQIGAADIAAAEAIALHLVDGAARSEALAVVARARVARDGNNAVNWLLELREDSARFDAERAVADALVTRDPAAAAAQVLASPAGPAREAFLQQLAAHWATRDATASLAWAEALADEERRGRVLTSVGFAVAQTDPERAARVAVKVPKGRNRHLLLAAIGQTWVARNSDAAWRWARQLPVGEEREAAISGIETGLGVAMTRSPQGGGDTLTGGGNRIPVTPSVAVTRRRDLASLPPGPDRDEEIRREFREQLLTSPVRAADWLSSLPAPDRSDEMVQRLTREWLMVNPTAAVQWLEQNVISSVQREHLLREAGALVSPGPR